jgi:hypothetical protein
MQPTSSWDDEGGRAVLVVATTRKVAVPRLASIIPVLGSTDGLETTLLSVLERRPADCEVLVALGVHYDDPYNLQDEVRFIDVAPGAGLVACLNAGLAAAASPIVHFLAPGFEVSDNWAERALAHFEDPRVAAVAPAIQDAEHRQTLSIAGVGYLRGGRRLVCRQAPLSDVTLGNWVGPLLQAAFYRKTALDALGGQLPTEVGDELADVDVALLLRQAGWKIEFAQDCEVFGPPIETSKSGGLWSGLRSERLFWRHWGYGSRIVNLFSHPGAVVGELANTKSIGHAPLHVIGRLAAMLQLGGFARYRQTIAAARLEAAVAKGEWESRQMQAQSRIDDAWHDESAAHAGQQFRIDSAHPIGRQTEKHTTAEPQRVRAW